LKTLRACAFTFALVVLASARAEAAEVADDGEELSAFEARPTAIYAILGVWTPVGFMGAELEQTIAPNWTMSAGAGLSTSGLQGSAMVHMLAGGERSKLTVGAGISGGKYTWRESCLDCDDGAVKNGTVAWGNVELGGEHRFSSGFAIRYFGGYGHVIAGDLTCDSTFNNDCVQYHRDDGYDVIYGGVGLGGAF